MNPVIQAPRDLVLDLGAEPGQAAEGGLDMAARTAKPVVQVQVAKSRIEVVTPQQADDTPAEPDTFRVAGWAIDGLGRFREFIGPALVFLGGFSRTGGGFGGLIGICGRPTLRESGGSAQDQR
jgi:hypothetical protein